MLNEIGSKLDDVLIFFEVLLDWKCDMIGG